LLKTIIQIPTNLNFPFIPHPIQTQEQPQFLIQNPSHLPQRYLYTPPITKHQIPNFLNKQNLL
ncbi:hypothetical protein, partial [Siminovitchia fortis]|uniref:hypothetical protein n=1 Tax=Siminovitchia fortis TaxID=254758 RepID=UPI001C92F420